MIFAIFKMSTSVRFYRRRNARENLKPRSEIKNKFQKLINTTTLLPGYPLDGFGRIMAAQRIFWCMKRDARLFRLLISFLWPFSRKMKKRKKPSRAEMEKWRILCNGLSSTFLFILQWRGMTPCDKKRKKRLARLLPPFPSSHHSLTIHTSHFP